MLNELAKAVEKFETVSDNELLYSEREILSSAFYADEEIKILNGSVLTAA